MPGIELTNAKAIFLLIGVDPYAKRTYTQHLLEWRRSCRSCYSNWCHWWPKSLFSISTSCLPKCRIRVRSIFTANMPDPVSIELVHLVKRLKIVRVTISNLPSLLHIKLMAFGHSVLVWTLSWTSQSLRVTPLARHMSRPTILQKTTPIFSTPTRDFESIGHILPRQ